MFPLAIILAALGPVFAYNNGYYYYGGPGCCCSFFIIWFFIWCIRKFAGEFERGKKQGLTDAEVLNELPKKKQVTFKGEKVPDWKIVPRSRATKAICKFLSYTDNWFERKYLADAADEAFRLVKEAIEARSVQGLERRVTPELLEELRGDIKKLKKNRERHVFGNVEVTD